MQRSTLRASGCEIFANFSEDTAYVRIAGQKIKVASFFEQATGKKRKPAAKASALKAKEWLQHRQVEKKQSEVVVNAELVIGARRRKAPKIRPQDPLAAETPHGVPGSTPGGGLDPPADAAAGVAGGAAGSGLQPHGGQANVEDEDDT